MRCPCQELKKEILTQIQGLFVSSAEIINPSTESSHFRLKVARPSGPDRRGCQRRLTLSLSWGAASPVQGSGEWACFLFIGSDCSGQGLFVHSARPTPWLFTVAPESLQLGQLLVWAGPGLTVPKCHMLSSRSMRACFTNVEIQAQGCKWLVRSLCAALVPGWWW